MRVPQTASRLMSPYVRSPLARNAAWRLRQMVRMMLQAVTELCSAGYQYESVVAAYARGKKGGRASNEQTGGQCRNSWVEWSGRCAASRMNPARPARTVCPARPGSARAGRRQRRKRQESVLRGTARTGGERTQVYVARLQSQLNQAMRCGRHSQASTWRQAEGRGGRRCWVGDGVRAAKEAGASAAVRHSSERYVARD